jgi:NAD(P) transhydrogenase
MLFHRKDRRLLAVHCLGTGARRRLDDFLETVFNYPTLAECYKVAALDASSKMRT